LRVEGPARDEIVEQLGKKGWIRGRRQGKIYFDVSSGSIENIYENKGFKTWLGSLLETCPKDENIVIWDTQDQTERTTLGVLFDKL
jgi:hypothetical protein